MRTSAAVGIEGYFVNLSERLQCLSLGVNHALLALRGTCIAVFRGRSGRYGYFDPHSRTANEFVQLNEGGTAIMLTFKHLSDMIDRLLMLYWGDNQYEFMPVSFESVNMTTDDNAQRAENVSHHLECPGLSMSMGDAAQQADSVSHNLDYTGNG